MNILLIFNFFLIVARHCSALNCHLGTYFEKPDGKMSHSSFEDGLGRSSACKSETKCITYSGTLKNKDTGEICEFFERSFLYLLQNSFLQQTIKIFEVKSFQICIRKIFLIVI